MLTKLRYYGILNTWKGKVSTMKIWFDMDGTIADLYSVENWLPMLINADTTPYAIAKPMYRMSALAKRLNTLQKQGHEVGIISWTSKNGTSLYNQAVTEVKKAWLRKHLASVHFDDIKIVPYGTPKHEVCKEGILFDDEQYNRDNWNQYANGKAFLPCEIQPILAMC